MVCNRHDLLRVVERTADEVGISENRRHHLEYCLWYLETNISGVVL